MPLAQVVPDPVERAQVEGRSVIARRLKALPIEAIVRGYLIGSGWKDYQATGSVSGVVLPLGLRQAERLPRPIFTPATKAAVGDHDENISYATAEGIGRRRKWPRRCATSHWRCTTSPHGTARSAASLSRTRNSNSGWPRMAHCC